VIKPTFDPPGVATCQAD